MNVPGLWMGLEFASGKNTDLLSSAAVLAESLCLPGSFIACIDVNKIRFRIETDTTKVKFDGQIAKRFCSQPRHSDINGSSLHVVAFLRNAFVFFAQQFIGFGGPVTRDHLVA